MDDISHAAPGTVQLVGWNEQTGRQEGDIILIPTPSNNPNDPLNWSPLYKHFLLGIGCFFVCSLSFTENILGPAWTQVATDTGLSLTALNGASGLNLLVVGLFCVFWSPIILLVGRRIVYCICSVCAMTGVLWGGVMVGEQVWLSWVFLAIGISVYEILLQTTIADMFFNHQRGSRIAVYVFFDFFGTVISGIAGGFIADDLGWRWTQWIAGIVGGGAMVAIFLFMEETKFDRKSIIDGTPIPVGDELSSIESKKIDTTEIDKTIPASVSVDKETACATTLPTCRYNTIQRLAFYRPVAPGFAKAWREHIIRPVQYVAFMPVLFGAVTYAVASAWITVQFNTSAEILGSDPYNFSQGSIGLTSVSQILALFVSICAAGYGGDFLVMRHTKRNGGIKEPESRLWLFVIPLVSSPVGLLMIGVGAANQAHWMVIVAGNFFLVLGTMSTGVLAQSYIIDSYSVLTVEVVTVIAVFKNVVCFAMSYAVQPFIANKGYTATFATFAGFSVASNILFIPMMIWGKQSRLMTAERFKRLSAR